MIELTSKNYRDLLTGYDDGLQDREDVEVPGEFGDYTCDYEGVSPDDISYWNGYYHGWLHMSISHFIVVNDWGG